MLDRWVYERGIRIDFSRPGTPTDNATVESFNGRLRQECLNENWFMSMEDARLLGLEPKRTAVRSPESNGMAESFVKTMKRDYINVMPRPDARTAVQNLAMAFEHYNEWHPYSALGYRSPREYLRRRQA